MGATQVAAVRNVALIGHSGAGKTTLAEALLHAAGAITVAGSIEKGSTVCDFDPLEKQFGHSLQTALVNFEWEQRRIYLSDTPGMPDFAGQSIAALDAADTAIVVIDAQTGVQTMTERMMRRAAERGLCRMIVVNKIDADNVDLPALLRDLRERFGRECLLLDLPAHHGADVVDVLEHDSGEADFESVADAHRALIDQIVEEDESLLARYLEDGADPSIAELHAPFELAMREGHLIPVMFTSARTGAGIAELLHILATLAPDPTEANPPAFFRGDPGALDAEAFTAVADPARHVIAHAFRVAIDPYMGRIAAFRVFQGTLRRDMQLYVGDAKRAFKVAHLYRVMGKEMVETAELVPGEIGAIAKVDEIVFDTVLHDSHDEDHIHLKSTRFPAPMQGLALTPRRKGDEQKLSEVLGKLAAEDPSLTVERDGEGHEWVIRGLGELHLKSKLERMSLQYKVDVDTRPPRIPYRETISANADGHHRHKKQSGGAGQFGEVFLRIEPRERGAGFEFVDQVKGGAIPGVFMAAVEKGVQRALDEGVVAGYPVIDVRVTVYDGKTHAVDGKEIAFVTAGRKATIDAIQKSSPIVLEPIVEVDINVPETYFGEVTGDISSRRGHVTGTVPRGHGATTISAMVPLAEIVDYSSRLKAITAGAGNFSQAFAHYAPAPPNVQRQLASSHKLRDDEE
ncbi:MAG: elongation factor G [Burkholderiaceae bacterium]|nr:elongation factor G [Burkholderiaceae bacterium]